MLAGATIANGVVDVLLATVVASSTLKPGGHDVPTRATLADEVERCELSRHVEWLVVRRCQRRNEADMRRRSCHGRQRGERLEAVEKMGGRIGSDVRTVDHEDEVELRGFRLSSCVPVPVDI